MTSAAGIKKAYPCFHKESPSFSAASVIVMPAGGPRPHPRAVIEQYSGKRTGTRRLPKESLEMKLALGKLRSAGADGDDSPSAANESSNGTIKRSRC